MFRKNLWILFMLAVAVLVGSLYGYYESSQAVQLSPATDTASSPRKVTVYITGAVGKPSLVSIPEGARVGDVVNTAGGLLPTADIDSVNMAQVVQDGEHIKIPVHPLNEGVISSRNNIAVDNGIVNINTAKESELRTLPGIGEAMSKRIIEYREQNGRYKSIEDIKKVRGIGNAKFDKIKDKIRV